MKKLILVVCIIHFLILGCSSKLNTENIPGKYCFNRNNSRDSIFLFKNNKYKHQYINRDGKLFFIEGEWEYDSLNSEILFKDFTFFNEEGPDELPRGNWFSKVNYVNDEIRLMYSSENNIYFSKVNSLNESNLSSIVKFSGNGNQTKELNLIGYEKVLKLSYEFYKESDELIIYDQNEKEIYKTGLRATTKPETYILKLSEITKLVFKINSNDSASKWKFSVELK
jgi:hypothetical protein